MTCEKCGERLQIGDWPTCPHGRASVAVHSDELIGGFVQENFGDTPEYFTSKKQMLQRADALGLRQASDGDRHRGAWTVSAKTLADAAVLLARGSQTVDSIPCETASFTERIVTLTRAT